MIIHFDSIDDLRNGIFDFDISFFTKELQSDNGSAGIILTTIQDRPELDKEGIFPNQTCVRFYGDIYIVTPYAKEIYWLYREFRNVTGKDYWRYLPDAVSYFLTTNQEGFHYKELLASVLDTFKRKYCFEREAEYQEK